MEIYNRKFQAQYVANLYKQIGYENYYNRINQCGRYLKYVLLIFINKLVMRIITTELINVVDI